MRYVPPHFTQAIGQATPVPVPTVPRPGPLVVNGPPAQQPTPLPPLVKKAGMAGTLYGAASLAGGVLGAYHGYKRNKSIFWALVWSFFGSTLPLLSMPIALAQGFAKPKKK